MKSRALISSTFVLLLLACACAAQQATVKGSKVVRVRGSVLAIEDSDRIKIVADDGTTFSAVLLAVDAPDEKQDFFKKAKKRLAELVEGKDVTVLMRTDDRGETFAVVYAGANDIGLKLIQEGFAWFSPNRSSSLNAADREKYTRTEAAARTARTGLWDDKNPVAPWAFRGEKVESAILETTTIEASAGNATEIQKRSSPVPGRKYILGPRGGCYYLNDQGVKVYVKDKSLCQNP